MPNVYPICLKFCTANFFTEKIRLAKIVYQKYAFKDEFPYKSANFHTFLTVFVLKIFLLVIQMTPNSIAELRFWPWTQIHRQIWIWWKFGWVIVLTYCNDDGTRTEKCLKIVFSMHFMAFYDETIGSDALRPRWG